MYNVHVLTEPALSQLVMSAEQLECERVASIVCSEAASPNTEGEE